MSLGTKLAVIAGVLLIAAASGIRFLTQTPAEEAERYPAPESTASLLGEQPAPRVRASVDAAAPRDRDVPDFFVPPEPVLPAGAAWQVRGRVAGVESGHPVLTVSAEMTAPPRLDPERVSLWDLHRQNRAGAGAAVPLALQAVPVEADGSFRVDVDALLAEQPACELVLRIDDPWYLPASLQLPMPELERQRLQEPDAELVLAAAR